jgi:HEAT repeat protein
MNRHCRHPRRKGCVLISLLLVSACARGPAAPPADPSLETILTDVGRYKEGESRKALIALEHYTARASADVGQSRALAPRLIAVLESPDATLDAKHFVCRQLSLVAGPEHAPALARPLQDQALSHMTRYILERMAHPAADKVLRRALRDVEGDQLIGVIDSIGKRRDAEAAPPLAELLKGQDEAAAVAASRALGKIGAGGAARAIAAARPESKGPLREALTHAWLRCAESLLEAGAKEEAAAIYEKLYDPREPVATRAAALRGRLAAMEGESPGSPRSGARLLVQIVRSDDLAMQTDAAACLAELPDPGVTGTVADLLANSPSRVQEALLGALVVRGDKTAAPAIAELARKTADEAVRLAAVRALGSLGGAPEVRLLAALAATSDVDLRGAGRDSLARMRGADVDRAIVEAVQGAPEADRMELIRALSARRSSAWAVEIARTAGVDESAAVRRQCFDALGELGEGRDLAAAVALMAKEPDPQARGAAEKAVVAIARRVEDPTARMEPILKAHAASEGGEARVSLLRAMGRLAGADAARAVRGDLKHADEAVRDAAVRALAGWPDASAAPDLLELAQSADNPLHRALALRNLVRLIGLPSDRSQAETIGMYEQAFAAATSADEKKLVLAGVSEIAHPDALAIARRCAKDPALKAEAEQAIDKIQAALGKPVASASHNLEAAQYAIDGDRETRWKSLVNQEPGIWFMLDLRSEKTVSGVNMDSAVKTQDYPRAYEVYVSNDPAEMGQPVATGKGDQPLVEVRFPPVRGRYVKIVQTGSAENNWSVYELKVDAK